MHRCPRVPLLHHCPRVPPHATCPRSLPVNCLFKSLSFALADHEFPPCITLPRISPLQWLSKGSPFAPPVQMIFHCAIASRGPPLNHSYKGFLLCEGCPRVPSLHHQSKDSSFPPSIQEFPFAQSVQGQPHHPAPPCRAASSPPAPWAPPQGQQRGSAPRRSCPAWPSQGEV